MPLLELKAISMAFPGVQALGGVSFDLEPGEIHAICGENGAGKSTLIKILCGYHPAGSYQGEVRLRGAQVHFKNLRAAEEHGIALIAQELALVPELSVAENMMLGREPVRGGLIQWDVVREEARRGLAVVGLDIDPDMPVKELGIGQQQMVEIAKALLKNASRSRERAGAAGDAGILVLDEPTAALTEADAQTLLGLLEGLSARGVSCIYISHRLEEVFQIADRITVLRDGRSITTQPAADMNPEKVIAAMVGREVKTLYPRPPDPNDRPIAAAGASTASSTSEGERSGAPVLRVEGWSVAHPQNPGRFVVQDVSFSVRAGEVLGVGGLMGSGRTALVSALFGAARSEVQGRLWIAGRNSNRPFSSPREAIAAGLALVSEDRKRYGLMLEASLFENMTLVTLPQFRGRALLDDKRRAAAAEERFESLRIRAPGLFALANQLSGGNQQKVVLAKWLMASPKVLLLDEPTRGIDVGAKAEIYQIIHRLAAEGLAVILVSSDLPELLGMSHRVLVLSQGRQTACLDQAHANPERVMAAATRKVSA